jgi:hypothetical protein
MLTICPVTAGGLVYQAGMVLLWETVRVTGQSTYCDSVRHNQVGMGSLATLRDLWWHPVRGKIT